MNFYTWIRRGLVFHRRMHLALAGGAALTTAVLAAAWLTGDALNRNLRRIALERVGQVRSAIELRGRMFDASLAGRLEQQTGSTVAPVLRLPATVFAVDRDGTEMRLDRVNAYGCDGRFLRLGRGGGEPAPGDLLLSRRAAELLGRPDGAASFSIRFEQPSAFPIEMPLGDRRGDRAVRRSTRYAGVLPDESLGRFALIANQIPPLNAFVGREWMAAAAGVTNRANLLVSNADPAKLEAALQSCLEPADLGVAVERLAPAETGTNRLAPRVAQPDAATQGIWMVHSDRIYLDEALVRVLGSAQDASVARSLPAPVFSLHHLIDSFAAGEGATAVETPYGFLTAVSPSADPRLSAVPAGMADDEIVINAWVAEKLRIGPGDRMTLRWRRFESGGKLVPDAGVFRVARVIDMAEASAERAWLPRFPGLSDADRCADWDVGMPMERDKLNNADNEAYWNRYGPTPKAFVTLAAGRLMLGTHFGSAMTARYAPECDPAAIRSALRRAKPADLGLQVRSAREEALRAVDQAMDFRHLFLGMALVLMVSALLLTGLLASLGVAQRRDEVGLLRAAGFSSRQVAFLWLSESLPPIVAGVVAGVAAGVGGAHALVWALNRFWSGAIASAEIPFAVGMDACVAAGAMSLAMSLLAVRWGVHRTMQVQVRDLLGEQTAGENCDAGRGWTIRNFGIGMGAAAGAIALLAIAGRASGGQAAGVFFGSGFLLMVSLLSFARLLVQFFGGAGQHPVAGPLRAGLLNVARHRGRSLLVMVLLATGCFLTVGVLSMKQDPSADADRPGSGSGGFRLLVETSIPLPGDKGDEAVRRALEGSARSSVLPFRVREGDEAGCLNLNRAQQPRLLGVSPDAAEALRAFEGPHAGASVWSLLKRPMEDDTIPVLAGDRTTVEYGLQAKAGVRDGSIYAYAGEDGTVWRLRVVGALPVRTGILQGSLLVDESVFTRLYPSEPGHALWLVRSESPEREVADRFRRALGRAGGLVTPARERLRLLGAVESTYLDMFLVLGGLGVVLGAAGVGLVVLRNAAARRGELAVLRALGLSSRQVFAYLVSEHVYVLLAGLAAGVAPALVAVQPAMRGLGPGMPIGAMALILTAMFAFGLLGTIGAVLTVSRIRLIEAMRGE